MASGDTKTEALLNILGNGGDASDYKGCCNTKTQSYILDAIDRVQNVEDEVEELKNNPDVVDIVDTYADLQAYDTQHLSNNDIIRVLADETHSGNSTYYRFTKNPDTWTFIGEISGGSSVNVVQTTGTSTTNVMSQNAVTSMVYADPATATKISIGNSNAGTNAISLGQSAYGAGTNSIAIGAQANTYSGSDAVAVGQAARARSNGAVAIGYNANQGGSGANGSVSIGAFSSATSVGEMNIGSTDTSYGYNSTNYRLLSGVHDAVGNHDAVTLGQLNTRLGNLTITTISQSDYNNLQTKDPNTLYLITGA